MSFGLNSRCVYIFDGDKSFPCFIHDIHIDPCDGIVGSFTLFDE